MIAVILLSIILLPYFTARTSEGSYPESKRVALKKRIDTLLKEDPKDIIKRECEDKINALICKIESNGQRVTKLYLTDTEIYKISGKTWDEIEGRNQRVMYMTIPIYRK